MTVSFAVPQNHESRTSSQPRERFQIKKILGFKVHLEKSHELIVTFARTCLHEFLPFACTVVLFQFLSQWE